MNKPLSTRAVFVLAACVVWRSFHVSCLSAGLVSAVTYFEKFTSLFGGDSPLQENPAHNTKKRVKFVNEAADAVLLQKDHS